jgi:hypothetical protein
LGYNINDIPINFNISRYGNFTANFGEIHPPIRQEYLFGIYTLSGTIFTGWLIPAMVA